MTAGQRIMYETKQSCRYLMLSTNMKQCNNPIHTVMNKTTSFSDISSEINHTPGMLINLY